MAHASNPPATPTISAEHRTALRTRIDQLRDSRGMSLRELERRMGRSSGTLSKVFTGRLRLTHQMLDELCQVLQVEPPLLVEGTGYAHLLVTAPSTPALVELEGAHAEIDRLRLDLAASQARAGDLEAARDAMRKARDQEHTAREKAERIVVERDADLAKAKKLVRSLTDANTQLKRSAASANETAMVLTEENAALVAKENEARNLMDAWRRYSLDRDARVAQLEAYIHSQNNGAAMHAVLGFGLGLVAGKRS